MNDGTTTKRRSARLRDKPEYEHDRHDGHDGDDEPISSSSDDELSSALASELSSEELPIMTRGMMYVMWNDA